MNAEYKKLFQSLEKKQYAPVYLIDGEEPYYLDKITEYFEDQIVPAELKDLSLFTLYGKDTTWSEVVNTCRQSSMFGGLLVVILKEASQLKDLGELINYIEKPTPSTVLLIEHRFKKVDGRGKITKVVKDKGFYFTSDKVKDDLIPNWIQSYGDEIGFKIAHKESEILATYLGNDLQKIANEIEKVRINVPEEKELSGALIQKFIGISREYNVFEFADTLTNGNKDKLYRMLSFFTTNAKSAPMPLVIGSFYSHFSKLYQACFLRGASDKDVAAALGYYKSKELVSAAQRFGPQKIESCMLLLGKYSAYAVGVGNNTDDSELLKEMIGKMDLILN